MLRRERTQPLTGLVCIFPFGENRGSACRGGPMGPPLNWLPGLPLAGRILWFESLPKPRKGSIVDAAFSWCR